MLFTVESLMILFLFLFCFDFLHKLVVLRALFWEDGA